MRQRRWRRGCLVSAVSLVVARRECPLTRLTHSPALWVSAVVLMVAASPRSSVRASIVGSAHDLSARGWSGGRICRVCHTPHGARTTVPHAPLWNHDTTQSAFVPYSSDTMDATPGQPTGVSKLCLSCHDGTVAIDSFGGQTGSDYMVGTARLGTDLTNDHPIAFTYDSALAAADGGLVDPAHDGDTNPDTVGQRSPYLPLFGGTMQCATCHDVHHTASVGHPALLIVDTEGSALCLTCHLK